MNTSTEDTDTGSEIERAFAAYQATVADMFTRDASYEEHACGTFSGREEIRSWVLETMTASRGNTMSSFPIAWHVVDAPTNRVLCEVRNLMPDPGDASVLGGWAKRVRRS